MSHENTPPVTPALPSVACKRPAQQVLVPPGTICRRCRERLTQPLGYWVYRWGLKCPECFARKRR
jgi:hypothetical protein